MYIIISYKQSLDLDRIMLKIDMNIGSNQLDDIRDRANKTIPRSPAWHKSRGRLCCGVMLHTRMCMKLFKTVDQDWQKSSGGWPSHFTTECKTERYLLALRKVELITYFKRIFYERIEIGFQRLVHRSSFVVVFSPNPNILHSISF